jgi:hypothetical protein
MKLSHKVGLGLLVGFVVGALWLAAVHFITFTSDAVHYHANFALYVNGQRDEFKSFTFYEEVQACSSSDATNPKIKVHMHDKNSGLVHVHAAGVTWGQFFENLGYTLGNGVLQTDKGAYVTDQDGNKLSFMLNGDVVTAIANRVIDSEDRLLINYGNDDRATLVKRYETIAKDAKTANSTADPATCSGSAEPTLSNRLKRAFGIPVSPH